MWLAAGRILLCRNGHPENANRTLALRSPKLVEALISVDNAPVDATLKSDFAKYIQGLQTIENAQPTKQIEADKILQKYEEV